MSYVPPTDQVADALTKGLVKVKLDKLIIGMGLKKIVCQTYLPGSPSSVRLSKVPHSLTPTDLESLAFRTNGYVGAGLGAVVRDARTITIKSHLFLQPSSESESEANALTLRSPHRPPLHSSQVVVKQKLKECAERPSLHRGAFERLIVKSPRDVLLYGPPGPELLNRFVEEFERAVREIFRKTPASSPSIVLLDEIDALARAQMALGATEASQLVF
ncbi:hypothetical protein BU17DRAFT_99047 [Hysterangium stoloniferum]|nr:hypothetical protein BU17DRAFT_99047 [Hysterangium stoloniferum]